MNLKGEMICPVCSHSSFIKSFDLWDDRYGYPGKFQISICENCGHYCLPDKISPRLIKDLYTNYYPRSSIDLRHYKPYTESCGIKAWLNGDFASAFRWVPEGVKILDIGCGFGETLGYHKSRGCDAYGVEADENILRVAEKFGFKVHVGSFDPSMYEKDCFDYVTMDQVLEHVMSPVETLIGIHRILKPGGHAIFSTPNPNGWGAKAFRRRWMNWHAPYHIQFFSDKSLTMAVERSGLLMEKCLTVTSSEWLYYQWVHLITYPQAGQPSGFWSPKARLKISEKIFIKLIYLAHKLKINHLITRLFDLLKLGDNYLVFLRKP